jgi:copper(I)-binding protein
MRVLLAIMALTLALSAQALAEEVTKVGNVMILDAWAHASHDVSNNSAVYMTLEMTAGRERATWSLARTCAATGKEGHDCLLSSGSRPGG